MAVLDVMGKMIKPSLAFISIARSEDLVACAQDDGPGASRTGRDDLQVRPIGPDADDAAAEPHRLVVSARAKRRAPVTDGQVKVAIHPQLDPTGDVIVPSARSGNRGPEHRAQVDALIGAAIAIGVAKSREVRRVNHVEHAVCPFEPSHVPKMVGKDPDLASLDRHDRAA